MIRFLLPVLQGISLSKSLIKHSEPSAPEEEYTIKVLSGSDIEVLLTQEPRDSHNSSSGRFFHAPEKCVLIEIKIKTN